MLRLEQAINSYGRTEKDAHRDCNSGYNAMFGDLGVLLMLLSWYRLVVVVAVLFEHCIVKISEKLSGIILVQ